MQQILIDIARRKQTAKRGANYTSQELQESRIAMVVPADELLAVHEALSELNEESPLGAEFARLRYLESKR